MRASSPASVGQQIVDPGLPANRCQGGVFDHTVVFGENEIMEALVQGHGQ
jgi:hypothetical protein